MNGRNSDDKFGTCIDSARGSIHTGKGSIIHVHLHVYPDEGAIADSDERVVHLPILGVIAAGEPIPVLDSKCLFDETITLPSDMLGDPEKLYALRVKGNSMKDALVDDGDIVIIRPQQQIAPHEMAVIWLKEGEDGKTTLKHLYQEGNTVWLRSANDDIRPRLVNHRQVEVQGKVVMVLRQYSNQEYIAIT